MESNLAKLTTKNITKTKLHRQLKYNLTSETTKSIMVLFIQPNIKHNCLTQLKFTNTQREKLSWFDRHAEIITGNKLNVNTENMIHKPAVKTVKKCINVEICMNVLNYFEVNNHKKATQNQKYYWNYLKLGLNLPKRKLSCITPANRDQANSSLQLFFEGDERLS